VNSGELGCVSRLWSRTASQAIFVLRSTADGIGAAINIERRLCIKDVPLHCPCPLFGLMCGRDPINELMS